MPVRNTIIVIGTGMQSEAVAEAAITPGQVVELLSTGKVQKKATGGTIGEKAVAIEDYLQGNTVADDYSADDRVLYRVFKSGDETYCILADGENVGIGDTLAFADAGEMKANGTTTDVVVAIAMEAVDASDSAATPVADRRIVVRWL